MSMKNNIRVCPTLLAAAFLIVISAPPLSAAEQSGQAPQSTCACAKNQTAKAKSVRAHAKRIKVAAPRPHSRPVSVRLASRLLDSSIRFQLPLYLGVAY
jgi:hypothetical protein